MAELMKKLFELFGDDVDLAYLDVKTEKWKNEMHYQQSNDDASLEPELADDLAEPECDDSLDDMMPQDSLAEPEMTPEYNIEQDINDD